MNISLSKPSLLVLRSIREFLALHGYAPTREEIRALHGHRSADVVTHHLKRLEKAGLVRFKPGYPRSIQVVHERQDRIPIIPLGPVPQGVEPTDPDRATGAVAPLIAEQFFPYPHMFVVAKDDSMAGIGVHDGDRIAIEMTDQAQNGTVVLAHLDGELVVRRLRKLRRAHPTLVAADPTGATPPIQYDRGLRPILGRMVGALIGTPPSEP